MGGDQSDKRNIVVFISTPIEPENVERIRKIAPDRVTVIAEPDLWPRQRYVADHKGVSTDIRNAEQEARWRRHLAKAEILWDVPPPGPDGNGGMSLAPNVRWVQTTSSGVGQLVKSIGLDRSDIMITTAKGVHAGPLAEFTFMALLTHIKRLDFLKEEQRSHRWERYCGDELAGKTLAIIGAGVVGGRIAGIARAFGMRVLAGVNNPSKSRAAELGVDAVYGPKDLHAMLAEADAVVSILPHTSATENMFDGKTFQAMKDGVIFVNIGRGQTVDEDALIESLRAGKVAFAALDVAAVEPLPEDSLLWDMPNVLISPHSASTVAGENERIAEIFCHNLACYLEGRPGDMRNVFDKKRLY